MRSSKKRIVVGMLICAGLMPVCLSAITGARPENPTDSSEAKPKSQTQKRLNALELLRKHRSKTPEVADAVRKERVIHFPKTRSLGRLMIEDENSSVGLPPFGYPFEQIKWEHFGQARDDVRVPTGKRIRLILHSWTWQNPQTLSALKQLRPDDIYSLILSPKWSSGGRKPSNNCMPYITHLTGLNTLNLDGANITIRGLEYLTELKSLERLKSPAGLGDSGMIAVGKLRPLKVLYIWENNSVTNEGLEQLLNLRSLELLVLKSVRMTDEGLKVLSGLPSLNHLILDGNFTNNAVLYLKDIPSLRTLKIDTQRFNDWGMQNISSLTQLENFNAHWIEGITDRGVAYLKNMPSLKSLDIGHAKLTDKAMLDLNQIHTLEYLRLPNYGLTDAGLKHVTELQNLRNIWVGCSSRSPLTDESLYSVSQLKNLEVLSIGGEGLTDGGMKHVAKLTNLKRLSIFYYRQLTDKGLAELAELESLTDFNLGRGTKVSVSGLKSLNRLKKLKVLRLKGIHQDNSVMDISGLTNLERLTILLHVERKGNSIVSDSFRNEDWACLANLTGLKTLQICGVGINDGGMKYLSGLTNLEYLNIICRGESRITDEGLKYLVNMNGLYRLYIKDGHFTDKALGYLDDLPSLSWLELTSDFAFSSKTIRDFQQKNPNITRLRLIP